MCDKRPKIFALKAIGYAFIKRFLLAYILPWTTVYDTALKWPKQLVVVDFAPLQIQNINRTN